MKKLMTNPNVPRIAGPVILGGLGGMVAGPPGYAAGSAIGTGLGEVGGQYLESTSEKPFDPLGAGSGEVAWEVLKDAALNTIPGTSVAKGTYRVARGLLAPFRYKVDEAHKAANAIRVAKGIPISPADYSGAPSLTALELFTERFPFLTGAAKRFGTSKEKSLEEMTEKVLRGVNPAYKETMEEIGKYAMSESATQLKRARDWSHVLYEAPKALIPAGQMFDTPDILHRAHEVVAELAKERGIEGQLAGTVAGRARLPGMPAVMAEEIPDSLVAKTIRDFNLDKPEAGQMDYERLEGVRKVLGFLEDKFRGQPEGRHFAMLSEAMGKGYDEVGRVVPEARVALERAKKYNKMYVQDDFVKNDAYLKIKDKDASTLVDRLFEPGVSLEEVRRIKRTMPVQAFSKLKAGMLYNMTGMNPAMVDKTFGYGEEFLQNAQKHSPAVMEEIFGKQDFKEIKEAITALNQEGMKRAAGRGQDLATGGTVKTQIGDLSKFAGKTAAMVGGAMYGYSQSPEQSAAAATLAAGVAGLSPLVVAQLLHSRLGRRYLTEGFIPRGKVAKGIGKAVVEGGGTALQAAIRQSIGDWPFPQEEMTAPVMVRGQTLPIPETPPLDPRRRGPVPVEMSRAFGGGTTLAPPVIQGPPSKQEFNRAIGRRLLGG
jgi:hypothetical protein